MALPLLRKVLYYTMRSFIRFLFLVAVKCIGLCCFRFEVSKVGDWPKDGFLNARLGILLNHTSLFEPVFVALLPLRTLWVIARFGVFPGADITMSRPIAGRVLRLLAQDGVSITRKRDSSWDDFLSRIHSRSLVLIAPEGRMKRKTGLDKEGKPMTVRSGVADILLKIGSGKAIVVYSGGLHHVHSPGEKFPKLFKTIRVAFEAMDIEQYLKPFREMDSRLQRLAIADDLSKRRDNHCPR
jgi:hypothetical protein